MLCHNTIIAFGIIIANEHNTNWLQDSVLTDVCENREDSFRLTTHRSHSYVRTRSRTRNNFPLVVHSLSSASTYVSSCSLTSMVIKAINISQQFTVDTMRWLKINKRRRSPFACLSLGIDLSFIYFSISKTNPRINWRTISPFLAIIACHDSIFCLSLLRFWFCFLIDIDISRYMQARCFPKAGTCDCLRVIHATQRNKLYRWTANDIDRLNCVHTFSSSVPSSGSWNPTGNWGVHVTIFTIDRNWNRQRHSWRDE